jgi:RNA polymerase sigma-54 factor
VDDNGYLDVDLATVAESLQTSVEDVHKALEVIQEFDPTGVAARDLKECLLIQAKSLEPPDPLVVAVLEEAFDLFQDNRLDAVARKLKVSLDEVKEASKTIASLNPKPGGLFNNQDTVYPVPDVYVIRDGKEYSVILNNDGLPRLKISSFYNQQLGSDLSPAAAKDYIQEKMRGAVWLIKSIHQRQRTIHKVAISIVKFQKDFFDHGINHLKPLILKDIAEDIEMHESTISRVTTNKYMHSPRGIFELKYFFNSGIKHGADSIASESVKNHIQAIIKNENPKRPTSDKQIMEELAKTDIRIARRTVAKYREMLGIPPSSKRRKKF